MRTLRYLAWISLFASIGFALACEEIQKTTESVETVATDVIEEGMVVGNKACADACQPIKGEPYQISKDCATCMRKNFKDNKYKLPKVKTPKGMESVRGFKVQQNELKTMLNNMGDENAEVYVMLSIRDTMIDGKLANIPEVVFVVDEEITAEDGTVSGGTTYYDFTFPCPNACPPEDN